MLVTYQVDVQFRTESYQVRSFNLSEEGILVQLDTPLALGTDIHLRFRLPGTEQDLSLEGKVVWLRTDGIHGEGRGGKGIEFKNVDPETRRILQDYVNSCPPHAEPGPL